MYALLPSPVMTTRMATDMSFNEIRAGTAEDQPSARTQPNLLGDENHKSFRRRLGILAILLLLVNLMIGLSARTQQRSLADYAIGTYDTTIVSTNYVHQAQISFRNYAEQRIRADSPAELSRADESLTKAIAQLHIAIERSNFVEARAAATAAKEKLVNLFETRLVAADLAARLKAISGDMEQLGELGTDVVLSARDDVAELADKLDQHHAGRSSIVIPRPNGFDGKSFTRAILRIAGGHAARPVRGRPRPPPARLQFEICANVWT